MRLLLPPPPTACRPLHRPPDAETVIRTHQAPLWRYLRLLGAPPDLADDLLQETFLRVLQGRLEHPHAHALRTVARHLYLDRLRRRQRRRTAAFGDAVDELLVHDPETLADTRVGLLRQCLDRLGGRARRALLLRHGEGLGQDAIGAELGIGRNGVKALLRRARDLLRGCVARMQAKERT